MKLTKIEIPTSLEFNLQSSSKIELPNELQDSLRSLKANSVTFARDNDEIWVLRQAQFTRFDLNDLEPFQLSYFTRGKGHGHIAIDAGYCGARQGAFRLCGFSQFSDGGLLFARRFAQNLEPVLGYVPEEVSYGADC